jgi:hypothetical protein
LKPSGTASCHGLTLRSSRPFLFPSGADPEALGFGFLVGALHDHERRDHIDQVGCLRSIDTLVGKGDKIDPSLNDAQK